MSLPGLAADGPYHPRRRHRSAQRGLRHRGPFTGRLQFGALVRHVLPNALAPIIVLATMELGVFIVAEATLSFLGIGLPGSIMSWGNDIAAAQAPSAPTRQSCCTRPPPCPSPS